MCRLIESPKIYKPSIDWLKVTTFIIPQLNTNYKIYVRWFIWVICYTGFCIHIMIFKNVEKNFWVARFFYGSVGNRKPTMFFLWPNVDKKFRLERLFSTFKMHRAEGSLRMTKIYITYVHITYSYIKYCFCKL